MPTNSHFKLINETNKMIRDLIGSSSKDVNIPNIKYIIFHKHGICAALLDPTLTNGEILILSRFFNLVFTSNLMSLSNLEDIDFGKLLISLLNGLKIHKSHYFWITTLGIFNQQSVIEFMIQSKQMLKEIRNIVTDQTPEAAALIRSTVTNISGFVIKLFESILINSGNVNTSNVFVITRISCYLVMYLLDETGLSGIEINSITEHLFKISPIIQSKSTTHKLSVIFKDEVLIILKKLNTDNILNLVPEVITFINRFLPFIAMHFEESSVVQSLCKCCCSMLQRTADSMESVQIMTIAGDIVNMGSTVTKDFLHDETNVKSLMGFIKILPNSVEHSDARNVFWWHMLCSLLPNVFHNRFKTYFIPFLENLLGVYLDRDNVTYGISEFNLANGYMHLSQFVNHVIINILDIIEFDGDVLINDIGKNILVPPFMHLARLSPDVFCPEIVSSSEYMGFMFYAIEIWMQILKYQQQQNVMNFKPADIQKITNKLPKRKSKKVNQNNNTVQRNRKTILEKNFNNYQHSSPTKSLSSHDMTITPISCITQDSSMQLPVSDERDHTNTAIPEILSNYTPKKQRIAEAVKGTILKSPKPMEALFDLENILKFFKFRNSDSQSNAGRDSASSKSISETDPKLLPLKKRKIEIDPSWFTNQTNLSEPEKIVSSQSENNTDVGSTDDDSSSNKNRHKYFIRSNPYGINENSFTRPSGKSSGKAKVSRSNVDFSVNVSEISKGPSNGDKNHKNKSSSKKVEFKIKFDLNPLSKICSDGIKLDITKNKCKSNHATMSQCNLAKT